MITFSLASAPWRFRKARSPKWIPAVVPGCVHTDLLRAGEIPDPFFERNELDLQWIERCDWEYKTEFVVSKAVFAEETIELVADGLDTVASLFLNGEKVGSSDNMFMAHRWDVARLLRSGKNELRIRFDSAMDYVDKTRTSFSPPKEFCDPVGNSARIRKQQCQFGWDWGPRLVSAGIWRDIRIEAWSDNLLSYVAVAQHHNRDGSVSLELRAEMRRAALGVELTAICSKDGQVIDRQVSKSDKLQFRLKSPELWWPSGQGAQPLYEIEVVARDGSGRELGTMRKRIGLRTIVLDRHPDKWGEAFQFLVNGRAVFIKGANWVPAHSFVADLSRADYARDLQSAVAAHMNCVRVWGGNIYESEDFYDLCDELGLLVWQDFMFACTLFPSDKKFIASVEIEACQQVRRLHHRACLALWCGNNELPQLNAEFLSKKPTLRKGYEAIFHRLLPDVVKAHDGATAYWPSSEWRGTYKTGHKLGEVSGDSHFWDVWHSRHPVKDYEKWAFRFCSEFGMQSYSSVETNRTFCPEEDTNVFGPAMENHQKNRSGNQIILDYVARRYRFPNSQESLIYLSQLNQAYCMQTGVEHYRRLTPRCMGALYWQLNDCWPGASWSSIEFTGRWKALHHAARRFFAPALACARVIGDEEATIGNYRRTTVKMVEFYTVYDSPNPADGIFVWELRHIDGTVLKEHAKKVRLIHGESILQDWINVTSILKEFGRDNIYIRLALSIGNELASEQSVFLTPPRFIPLPRGPIGVSIHQESSRRFSITLSSDVFQHAVDLNLEGIAHRATDNFFDLYPERTKVIRVELEQPSSLLQVERAVRCRSLVNSYD